ncbi:MAG: family 16 glycosylhydrolase [Bacteroidetes bacterium]|nr:family 16 glycosylhydrolase [Bacteroidota bacterium]
MKIRISFQRLFSWIGALFILLNVNLGYAQGIQKSFPDSIIAIINYDDSLDDVEDSLVSSNTAFTQLNRMLRMQTCRSDIVKIKPTSDINLCSNNPYIQVFYDDFKSKLQKGIWHNAWDQLRKSDCQYLYPDGTTDSDPHKSCLSNEFDEHATQKQVNSNSSYKYRDLSRTWQWYNHDNAYTTDGLLNIKALQNSAFINNGTLHYPMHYWDRWEETYFDHYGEEFKYESGRIDMKYEFQYGMFHAKIKLPDMHGMWPAFWLYGSTPNVWNEIDIFEFWDNNDRDMKMTIHGQVDNEHRQCQQSFHPSDPQFFQKFHIYTCYWTPYAITMSIKDENGSNERLLWIYKHYFGTNADDCTVKGNKWSRKQLRYPETPMRIIFNMAVQSCDNFAPSAGTFPRTMEVDWVKVFQQKPCTGYLTISDLSALIADPKLFNVITGEQVNVNVPERTSLTSIGNCYSLKTIPNDCAVKTIVSKRFTINKSSVFSVDKQAYFRIETNSNLCAPFGNEPPPIDAPSSNSTLQVRAQECVLNLYPNPVSEKLNIPIAACLKGNTLITITDCMGNVHLRTNVFNKLNYSVSTENLKSGIYIVTLKNLDSNRTVTDKAIICH